MVHSYTYSLSRFGSRSDTQKRRLDRIQPAIPLDVKLVQGKTNIGYADANKQKKGREMDRVAIAHSLGAIK